MRTNTGRVRISVDVAAARVAHRGAQAARELLEDRDHAALVRHAALDAFGHELLELGGGVLEVAVGGAMALRHGAERAHAAVGLVGSALVELHFAGGLLGAGEEAADHDRVRAGDDRLGDVAGEADTAVGDHRHVAVLERLGHVRHRARSAARRRRRRCASCRWSPARYRPSPRPRPLRPARVRLPRWRCCRR